MINKIKLGQIIFIVIEFVFGFGFGILGAYVFSFFDKADIMMSVFNTFLIAYISMTLGVVVIGYFHYRAIGKSNQFGKAIGWCMLGLMLFLIFYVMINALFFKFIPYYISSMILPAVMPTIGAVIGINYLLFKERIFS